MLTKYINAAMNTARYEIMEDVNYYGEIPPCPGVWASGKTLEKCREELQEVSEEWLILKLKDGYPIPVIAGIDLQVEVA